MKMQVPQRRVHRIALAWCAFFGIMLIAGTIMRVAETFGGMFSVLALPFGVYAFGMTGYHLLRLLAVAGRRSVRILSAARDRRARRADARRGNMEALASAGKYQFTTLAGAYAAPWQQAEVVAAAALRQFGFIDARITSAGADGGLDVVGRGVAAQVKYTGTPVGRPAIQQLLGAANGRQAAFFSLSGYTQHAVEAADARGMALFLIALPSSVRTQNAAARIMVRGHDRLGDAIRGLREWADKEAASPSD